MLLLIKAFGYNKNAVWGNFKDYVKVFKVIEKCYHSSVYTIIWKDNIKET